MKRIAFILSILMLIAVSLGCATSDTPSVESSESTMQGEFAV